MTLIIAQPVFDVNLTELCATARECYYIGTNASNTGVALASDALNESISDRVETYIKDKAAAYGSDLKAEVQLDENFQPRQVRIAGKISPYAKTQMQSTIEIDLGIAKENQLWINFP
jgi:hypothetical protein